MKTCGPYGLNLMEVSGQLYDPATLPPGSGPLYEVD
jgi:hypothetical protein